MAPRIGLIELVVADMGRALAFYGRLGIDVPTDSDDAPHVDVALPGGLRIAFDTEDTIKSFDESWRPPGPGGHRLALAFECDSPADVDATYAAFVESGTEGHLEPWDAFWGHRYAVIVDPDGNHVDLFAPLS